MEEHRYVDDAEPGWYSGQSQYARSADPQTTGSGSLSGPAGGANTSGNIFDSGVHDRPSGAFRLPEPRPGVGSHALSDPVTSAGNHARPAEPPARAGYDSVRIPVRGPGYPTVPQPGSPPATGYGGPAPVADQPPLAPVAEPTGLAPPLTVGERPRFDQPRPRDSQPRPRDNQPRPRDSVYRTRRSVSFFIVAAVMVVLMIPVVRLLVEATFTGAPNARGVVPAVLLTLGFTLAGIGLFSVAGGGPLNRESWSRPPVAYLAVGLILLVAAGLAVA